MWTDKGEIKGPFEKYHSTLAKYGCTNEDILMLQTLWNEPLRVYHNQEHLEEIIYLIEHWKTTHPAMTETEMDIFILCAIFHDAVYNARAEKPGQNELDSAELFLKMCVDACKVPDNSKKPVEFFSVDLPGNGYGKPYKTVADFVYDMIIDTKDHTKKPSSFYSEEFLAFDLHGMAFGSLSRMISDEAKMMREYGFVDYETYHTTRGTMFLEKYAKHIKTAINPNSKVDEYLDWYKHRTPNIAVFAGTFFPFHKGHLDILHRAERIFDKVIVLCCINPTKDNDRYEVTKYIDEVLRKTLPNNQVEFYNDMVHKYVKSKPYPLTVVKGLRNASDFDSEKLQLRHMEDFYPEINVTYIVSDRKYEHVSSSGVKMIQGFGEGEAAQRLYLP